MLRRSSDDFGPQARDRYQRLLDQTLMDLRKDPNRVGVRPIGDVREGYCIYHLRSSAERTPQPSVRQPRHLVAFYIDDAGDVIVARVFHERQMLSRHLVADDG